MPTAWDRWVAGPLLFKFFTDDSAVTKNRQVRRCPHRCSHALMTKTSSGLEPNRSAIKIVAGLCASGAFRYVRGHHEIPQRTRVTRVTKHIKVTHETRKYTVFQLKSWKSQLWCRTFQFELYTRGGGVAKLLNNSKIMSYVSEKSKL